ncbi:MAG: hypothetical protein IK123_06380 [Lachnospiraceae bacterium]|nr:hypothetical protein [Lachnospiraceae bacterium]
MSTFTIHNKKKLNSTHFNIILFALILIVFMYAIRFTAGNTLERQEDALNRAMQRDIVQCYAENGYYPPSLDYIKEHYGLMYDDETFFVDYTPIGGNIYPGYRVVRLNGSTFKGIAGGGSADDQEK